MLKNNNYFGIYTLRTTI